MIRRDFKNIFFILPYSRHNYTQNIFKKNCFVKKNIEEWKTYSFLSVFSSPNAGVYYNR